MQHTNTTSYLRSMSFLFLLLVFVVSSVPVAYADQVPRVPFNLPVPRDLVPQPPPEPAQLIPPLNPQLFNARLAIVSFDASQDVYGVDQPILFSLVVRNTGLVPIATRGITVSAALERLDVPGVVNNAFDRQVNPNPPEQLQPGEQFTYQLSRVSLPVEGQYRFNVHVTYIQRYQRAQAEPLPGIPRIPGFERAGEFLPPQPRVPVIETLGASAQFRVAVPVPAEPTPVEPVVPQQQNHDRDDAENAIDDAQDAMRRADCLIDVAEDDVRENYGHAEVRETTVRSAKQDLRRVGNLIDDAQDEKRARNYDGAVDRAEDAEDEAEDIVRLLRRYYSCHLVDGGNDYDTRSGRYDDDYDYNYYNNQDDTSNDRSSSDQSNGANRASNDDFLSAEHRQRLLDNLNQANQDTPTQNVAGGGAEGDQVIDVQRIPVLQDRQSKTESPSPSLWDLGNMNSGFVVALAIAGLLLMLVEIVLAVQYFRK
ncbi:TPA: hypothetical protein HA249_00600 [Candidatus Woesearchaeota archaeon]|nr:hypothetical protein [Candidatus Woesearchaeota archaeon]